MVTRQDHYDSPAAYTAALSEFFATDSRVDPFRNYHPADLESGAKHLAGVQRLLFDEGWSRLGWPESTGGLGGDPRFRACLFETMWNFDIPIPEPYSTLEILVPVCLVYAPHLANVLLPSLLRGDESWAQAFSEPDAGSDLASLRTRMEPDGDGYRLTGQKVWSTFGHLSQRSVLLARSGGPGHRGLTMVLIDLDQEGVEVRPIRAEDGENHFSEIFLDNAYVPGDRVIGELGQGWAIAMYMLQWERGAYGWIQQGRFHNRLQKALEIKTDGPIDARAIGNAYTKAAALRLHTRETVTRLAREETLGPEVSIDKLLLVDAELATWDTVRQHLGARFDLEPGLSWLRHEYIFSRAAPIYGGSQEIQRTLVAAAGAGNAEGSKMMDAEMIDMLRGSLRHVLTETSERPLADRLADLGWDEVLAEDEATALLILFEVKGDTRSPADALGPLLAGTIAAALGDSSLGSASVAFPTSLNPLQISSTVEGTDLHLRATLLTAPGDSTTLLVPVAGDDGVRLALVGSAKGFEFEAVAETDETQPWVTITGTVPVADLTWFDGQPGADAWTAAVAKGRWALSSELIGMAKRTIADAVTYTGERQQYGKAIGTFQALQHRLASAYGSVIGAGHLAEEAAVMGDRWTALVAKASAGRAAEDACTQAQQCYGAIGFTWEHDFHRYLRRTYVLDRLLGDWRSLEVEIGNELVATEVVPKIGSF